METVTHELLETVTGGNQQGSGAGGGIFGPGAACISGELVVPDGKGGTVKKKCVNGRIVHEP